MPSGRPRTVSPSDEELEALGQQMVDFVSDEANNVLHLTEWWSTHMFFEEKVWDTICRRQIFVPYYDKALRIIGKKYLDKGSNVRDSISHRWLRHYFKDLKRSEDDEFKFKEETKAKLAKEVAETATQQQKTDVNALIACLERYQLVAKKPEA